MATTRYLYHALGLGRYQHLTTQYRGGDIYYHVSRNRGERRCAGRGVRWYEGVMQGGFSVLFACCP